MIRKISIAVIIITVIAVNVLRFWQLDKVPYGLHVDELAGSVTVRCIGTEGVDAHLVPHPLFCDQHYGTPKPPVYIYPAVAWAKMFGYTAESLRAFTAFVHVLGLLGLFVLGRMFFGAPYGLITVLVASISPWSWPLSRLAYESSFCAVFIIWGLWFYLRSNRIADKAAAGLLLCATIYSYPPARAYVPLMLPALFLFDRHRQGVRKTSLAAFVLALIAPALPMARLVMTGELQGRFNQISMFSAEYLKSIGKTNSLPDLVQVFWANYATHLTPAFLFLKGDPSYVHSTGHFGIFGWLDLLGFAAVLMVFLLKRKDGIFLLFLIANFFIAIIPSGLTNSELPNSLRIITGWPFTCLLAGYGLWQLGQQWRFFPVVTALAGAMFAGVFLRVYFTVYPVESKGMFNFWTKEEAETAKTEEDWLKFMANYSSLDYHFRYYLMKYRGDTCSSSRVKWQRVRQVLGLPKIY